MWLSEETKWLAVTHKSFDQGKRGFNDRLSYLGSHTHITHEDEANDLQLGKRIVDLQTSYVLASAPRNPAGETGPDQFLRKPFEHPALEGLTNLSERAKGDILHKRRLAQLAERYGIDKVMRWKPRNVRLQAFMVLIPH